MQAAGSRVRQPWPTSRMLTVTATHTCMLTMLEHSATIETSDGAGLRTPTYIFKVLIFENASHESVHVVQGWTEINLLKRSVSSGLAIEQLG